MFKKAAFDDQAMLCAGEDVFDRLIFRVGALECGIDVQHVVDVRDVDLASGRERFASTAIDVLPLNGQLIPVADMRQVLVVGGIESASEVLIVLTICGRTVAIMVDRVCSIEAGGQQRDSGIKCHDLDIDAVLALFPVDPS